MEVQSLHNKDIDQEQWDEIVHASPQGSVYALSGFLDIVHPEWWGILAKEGKQVIAAFPVFPKQKWGIRYAFQPRFGQHQGILFGNLGTSTTTREYDKKRKIVQAFTEVVQQQFKLFGQNFSPSFDYPLPFHWAGFSLHARYTYQLQLPGDEEKLFNHFSNNHLTEIRKAIKRGYKVRAHPSVSDCLDVIHNSLAHKKDFIERENKQKRKEILEWSIEQECGFPLVIEKNGNPQCAGFFLTFHNTIYYLFGGAYREAKQSGAMYLAVSEGMKQFNQKGRIFDFEGSMIQPIERFFQGFGSHPVPYLHIYKNQLPLRILWQMLGY